MTEHEFDFTDAPEVTIIRNADGIAVSAHYGTRTESVFVALPKDAGLVKERQPRDWWKG